MKPVIIYQSIDNKNKIIIDKEEFEKLIEDVYEQGRRDGIWRHPTPVPTPSIPSSPSVPSFPTHPIITWSSNKAVINYPNDTTVYEG